MPLVLAGAEEQAATGPGHEQARKIHPRYARGELVRVSVARNLAEAELIKGVLLEQGIPSLIRRTAGFDVPDFLAAGPRDILVPEAGAEEARSLLGQLDSEHGSGAEWEGDDEPSGPTSSLELRAGALLLALLLAFGAVAGVIVGLAR
jgi:hypothetical protein